MSTDYGSPELNNLLGGASQPSTKPKTAPGKVKDYGSPELNSLLGGESPAPAPAAAPQPVIPVATKPKAPALEFKTNDISGREKTYKVKSVVDGKTTYEETGSRKIENPVPIGQTIKAPFLPYGVTVPEGGGVGAGYGVLKSLIEFPEKATRSLAYLVGKDTKTEDRTKGNQTYQVPSYAEVSGKTTAQLIDEGIPPVAASILGSAAVGGQFAGDALQYAGILESGAQKATSRAAGITSEELKTAHEFLGNPATLEEAKANYLKIQKEFHPDITGGSDAISKQANNAYRILEREGIPTGKGAGFFDARPKAKPAVPKLLPTEANGTVYGSPELDSLLGAAKGDVSQGTSVPNGDKPVGGGDSSTAISEIGSRNKVDINFRPEENGTIHLDKFLSQEPGQGNFKKALDELIQYADKSGIRLTTTPGSDFGADTARLEKTLRERGFNDNPLKDKQSGLLSYEPKGSLPGINKNQSSRLSFAEATPLAEKAANLHYEAAHTPALKEQKPIVIGADDLKDHFGKDYNDNNHPIYSQAAHLQYERALAETPSPNVIFTGGGPASGKTELITKDLIDKGFKGILYDSNMANFDGVKKQIEMARNAGKNIEIHGVLPNIEKARTFSIQRENQIGRGISDKTFARGHAGFPATVLRLLEEGVIKPSEVKIFDTREIHTYQDALAKVNKQEYVADPLATLKSLGYNESELEKKYGKENYNATTGQRRNPLSASGEAGNPSPQNRPDQGNADRKANEIRVAAAKSREIKSPYVPKKKPVENLEAGFIAPGRPIEAAIEKAKAINKFLDETSQKIKTSENLADDLYKIDKNNQADRQLAIQTLKDLPGTSADYEKITEYIDDKTIELSPLQKEIYQKVIRPIQEARTKIFNKLKDEKFPVTAEDYSPRFVKGRGNVIDRLISSAKEKRPTFSGGGKLTKGGPMMKSRVMRVLIDENGERHLVAIKKGFVTEIKKGVRTDLGPLKTNRPQFKEFFDAQVMAKLEQVAKDLGIKHERVGQGVRSAGLTRRMGVSFQGENKIKTRAGTPEQVILHELGHQIDYKYGLQNVFLKSKNSIGKLNTNEDLSMKKLMLDFARDSLENNPAKELEKYVARSGNFKGELPEVLGKSKEELKSLPSYKTINSEKTLEWIRKGDQIVEGINQNYFTNWDSEDARAAFEKYQKSKIEAVELEKEVRALRKKISFDNKIERNKIDNIQRELRDLADLKHEGLETSDYYRKYVRKSEEKIAQMFEAYLAFPERFQEVAPTVFENFKDFLSRHQELKPILDIKRSFVTGSAKVNPKEAPGIFKDKNGKKYKIAQATIKEIEANTNLTYHKNAIVNEMVSYLKLRQMERAAEFVESFKESPQFSEIAVGNGEEVPEGWKPTTLPQFMGYNFEPRVAEVLNDFNGKMQEPGGVDLMLGPLNRFLRNAIFFNPAIHIPNIAVHGAVNYGVVRLAQPAEYKAAVQAFNKAFKAIMTQNDDYIAVLRAGGPMMSGEDDSQALGKALLEKMAKEMETDPALAEKISKALSYANPAELVKAIYRFSGKATWLVNDLVILQSVYQDMAATGRSLEEAIRETTKHIPDYRLPSRIGDRVLTATMGENIGGRVARGLAKTMGNTSLFMFGKYHYGALKSYGEMINDLVKRDSSFKDRAHVIDKLAMMAIIGLILYPQLDKVAKKVTGNPNAKFRRAGALTFPYNAYRLAKNYIGVPQFLQSILTPSPLFKGSVELGFNVNTFTLKPIYGNAGSGLAQYLEDLISPLQQANKVVQGKTSGANVLASFIGISSPKNSDPANAINKMVYEEKPVLNDQVKRLILEGNKTQANALGYEFNQRLKQNIVEALKEKGMPTDEKTVNEYFDRSAYKLPGAQALMNFSSKPKAKNDQSIIGMAVTYAHAIGVDPLTAFNRIFTGQKITRVTNGTVIVQRMSLSESQKKKKDLGDPTGMTLDHIIPLELGGSNSSSNLKLFSKEEAAKADKIENYLGDQLNSGKITKKEAQQLIIDFKNGKIKEVDIYGR